ncbi:MAG: M56 family metallopeptidase [Sphingomonas sp.]|uniref:M56 family metallopeptidase n=1 Tax=Sphingomonas sp. TaxID=28214 RepID=UPI00260B3869|nr:M56 family metallopeptidase [Sphingomonas sp.]MDK2770448.1 M56 family metallopeptidase [Sphingomonas sp.]
MTSLIAWGIWTLLASSALMVLVIAIRAPVRRWLGPRLSYYLWALPTIRMILPPLPLHGPEALLAKQTSSFGTSILFIGPRGALDSSLEPGLSSIGTTLFAVWLAGAAVLLSTYAIRYFVFCSRLRREGAEIGSLGRVSIVAADIEGPLSFGVFRRFIVVPCTFARDYDADERDLVFAHEIAHHLRGDLIANWVSLFVLAAHWWNPGAWLAIRAFREDQEFAVDAHVLASRKPDALPLYAQVLAKAAGIGTLPACNLKAQSNLKGRLITLRQRPRSNRCLVFGGVALTLLGGGALAATAPGTSGRATSKQVVTIGVKPDGSGGFALIVDGMPVTLGAPLPGGMTLPADFSPGGGCDLARTATPVAMVIKGSGGVQTYTVICASATPAPVHATLTEGLASLQAIRSSVAAQRTPNFPEAERAHALRAIDNSIREVAATLVANN